MGYMSTIKDVCARKARKSSVVSCGHYVTMGQLIVRIGGRWVCGYCAYTREYGIPYRSAS
jgi:ribosomal protein S27AE